MRLLCEMALSPEALCWCVRGTPGASGAQPPPEELRAVPPLTVPVASLSCLRLVQSPEPGPSALGGVERALSGLLPCSGSSSRVGVLGRHLSPVQPDPKPHPGILCLPPPHPKANTSGGCWDRQRKQEKHLGHLQLWPPRAGGHPPKSGESQSHRLRRISGERLWEQVRVC